MIAAEAELNEEEEDEPEDLATLANMVMDAAEEDWYTQVEEPRAVPSTSFLLHTALAVLFLQPVSWSSPQVH